MRTQVSMRERGVRVCVLDQGPYAHPYPLPLSNWEARAHFGHSVDVRKE